MDDTLEERVAAIERAITDGHVADGLPEAGGLDARLETVEGSVEDLEERLTELEAAVQALRGYAGGIDAVDEAVERRANAAIARVERLETELRAGNAETTAPTRTDRHGPRDGVGGEGKSGDLRDRPTPRPERETERGDQPNQRTNGEQAPLSGEPGDVDRPTGATDGQEVPHSGAERGPVGPDDRETTLRSDTHPPATGSTDTSLAAAAAETAENHRPSEFEGADHDEDTEASSLGERLRRLL